MQLQPPWSELSPELGDDWVDPDEGQCSEVKKMKIKSWIKFLENIKNDVSVKDLCAINGIKVSYYVVLFVIEI